MQNTGFLAALRLFNTGCYFEAHEAWEQVWNAAEEPERRFLQGLIQATVAMHHYRNRNLQGAISLASKALRKLDAYPASFAGIDLGAFRSQFAAWLEAAKAGGSPSAVCIQLVADYESGNVDL